MPPGGIRQTVALADWARRSGRSVAWLSLDAGDNDPVRFWRYVVAAVGPARPGVAGRLLPLFGPPPPSSFDGPVTALINELAAQPADGEAVLILDDYHLIDAGPVHESLLLLAEHLPPGLRLVLASRSDPPLPLGRLRAAVSSPSCAPPSYGSPRTRPRRCCSRRRKGRAPPCPMRTSPR
jgi:LuxR family transcriptional regulator, maltose regulon positive regulatory protein